MPRHGAPRPPPRSAFASRLALGALAIGSVGCGDPIGPELTPDPMPAILAAGGYHTCAVAADGLAYCWGLNDQGQLGDGSTVTSPAPSPVSGGLRFVSLTAGFQHTCGVAEGGGVYCWGRNEEGELGSGHVDPSAVPAPVDTDLSFVMVSGGTAHTCGITTEGDAYCWGDNRFGQLGTGLKRSTSRPVRVAEDPGFAWVAAGSGHTCALGARGRAYCWGRNGSAQLGSGWSGNVSSNTLDAVVPRPVTRGPDGDSYRLLDAGYDHNCVLGPGDAAFCWGADDHGALGWNFGGETVARPWGVPVPVEGGQAFATVAAGGTHSCGVTVAGEAYCWGRNSLGELGSAEAGDRVTNPSPVRVADLPAVAELALGREHSCAATTEGAVYCWGSHLYGQLGPVSLERCPLGGTSVDPCSKRPVRVEGLRLR